MDSSTSIEPTASLRKPMCAYESTSSIPSNIEQKNQKRSSSNTRVIVMARRSLFCLMLTTFAQRQWLGLSLISNHRLHGLVDDPKDYDNAHSLWSWRKIPRVLRGETTTTINPTTTNFLSTPVTETMENEKDDRKIAKNINGNAYRKPNENESA